MDSSRVAFSCCQASSGILSSYPFIAQEATRMLAWHTTSCIDAWKLQKTTLTLPLRRNTNILIEMWK